MGAHFLNAVLGLPAELTLGLGGIAPALGDVAGAARVDDIGDLLAAGLAEGVDDVQHAVAVAGAQIADEQAGLLLQLFDGSNMAAGQVDNMDVVAHAGAVGGRVVIAKDVNLLQLADSDLGDVGHEVVGDAVGVLADQAGRMRTDGVEVTQQRNVQLGVGVAAVGQDALGEHLRGAVGVRGAADGEILADGHAGGVAVDRGGGGEDDVVAVVAAHDVQNVQRAGQIVGVVLDGLGNALADGLVGGELDDTVNVLVLGKDLLHGVLVGHVGLDKTEVLAGDLLDAGQGLGAGVVVVIGYNDVVPCGQKFHTGVAADVAGATANQNCHNSRLLMLYDIVACEPGGSPLFACILLFLRSFCNRSF